MTLLINQILNTFISLVYRVSNILQIYVKHTTNCWFCPSHCYKQMTMYLIFEQVISNIWIGGIKPPI